MYRLDLLTIDVKRSIPSVLLTAASSHSCGSTPICDHLIIYGFTQQIGTQTLVAILTSFCGRYTTSRDLAFSARSVMPIFPRMIYEFRHSAPPDVRRKESRDSPDVVTQREEPRNYLQLSAHPISRPHVRSLRCIRDSSWEIPHD